MRICVFANAHNTHVQRLTADWACRGHDVHVVTHKPVSIPGVTVEQYAVPSPGLRHPHRWEQRRQRYLRGFLKSYDVALVFFLHDWGFTPETLEEGCLIARPAGSDIVCPPGEGPPSSELIEKRVALLQHASAVGTAGPSFAKVVAEFAGLDFGQLVSLPLGVDTELFDPDQFDSPSMNENRTVLRVGFFKGFREVYGAEYLVRAIPAILAEVPHTMFDFVGDGPTLESCKQLADELGVTNSTTWTPRQPHDRIPQWLSRWDVVACPSVCESFGAAALEASAMGIPVVASRVCGFHDTVIDEETGLLVTPQSPQHLATALIRVLSDSRLRQDMGVAGRTFVQEHVEWNRVSDRWLDAFQNANQRRHCHLLVV